MQGTNPAEEKIPSLYKFARSQMRKETRRASSLTEKILSEIMAHLRPGLSEAEAGKIAVRTFEKYRALGLVKHWHPPKIYFGSHTCVSIEDRIPGPSETLRDNDIAYIDIGPVFDFDGREIEGDIGRTFIFGSDPALALLAKGAKELFRKGVLYWKSKKPTGKGLYDYIRKEAEKDDFVFNLKDAGHLIGTFPHYRTWNRGLSNYPHFPEAGVWILEIQLRHHARPYGAFYEDILQ